MLTNRSSGICDGIVQLPFICSTAPLVLKHGSFIETVRGIAVSVNERTIVESQRVVETKVLKLMMNMICWHRVAENSTESHYRQQ